MISLFSLFLAISITFGRMNSKPKQRINRNRVQRIQNLQKFSNGSFPGQPVEIYSTYTVNETFTVTNINYTTDETFISSVTSTIYYTSTVSSTEFVTVTSTVTNALTVNYYTQTNNYTSGFDITITKTNTYYTTVYTLTPSPQTTLPTPPPFNPKK
jgi:hypothetical protein